MGKDLSIVDARLFCSSLLTLFYMVPIHAVNCSGFTPEALTTVLKESIALTVLATDSFLAFTEVYNYKLNYLYDQWSILKFGR